MHIWSKYFYWRGSATKTFEKPCFIWMLAHSYKCIDSGTCHTWEIIVSMQIHTHSLCVNSLQHLTLGLWLSLKVLIASWTMWPVWLAIVLCRIWSGAGLMSLRWCVWWVFHAVMDQHGRSCSWEGIKGVFVCLAGCFLVSCGQLQAISV